MRFHMVVLSILLSAVSPVSAAASESCRRILYSTEPATILPESAVQLIRKHPLSKLGAQLKAGEGLVFESYDLPRAGGPDHQPKGAFGETLQARFVRETLRLVFPQALFVHPSESNTLTGKKIRLQITDSAEDFLDGMIGALEESTSLEMSILKQANPGRPVPSKHELRARFGIRADETVISIYASQWNFPFLPEIIEHLFAIKKPLVLIISGGGHSTDKAEINAAAQVDRPQAGRDAVNRTLHAFSKAVQAFEQGDLSTLTDPKLGSAFGNLLKSKVIFNDTYGKMPEIYALSDLAVVAGPINFIEPLAQGTPTVFLTDPEIVGDYPYLSEMILVAQATHRGFAAPSMKGLEAQARAALQSQRVAITPPHLVKLPTKGFLFGRTVFEKYLDHLHQYLMPKL